MKVSFFALAMMLLLPIYSSCAKTQATQQDSFQAGKIRLLKKLEGNILETRKNIAELRTFIAKYNVANPPVQDKQQTEFSVDAPHRLQTATFNLKRQQELLELIKKEQASYIPALLAKPYLHSCTQGDCYYPQGDELIIAFGALALQPLLENFKSLDVYGKNSTLRLLLQIKPAQCPESVLDTVLAEPVFEIRVDALKVYKNNCSAEAAEKKLSRLFLSETESQFLLYLIEQISNEDWATEQNYNHLLQLAQQQRIPANIALQHLCALPRSLTELNVDALNISFWLNQFATEASRRTCLIKHLFLNLHQEKQLINLHTQFHEAVEHHYRFSGITNLYGFTSPSPYPYWDGEYRLDEKFLVLFQKHLHAETFHAWRQKKEMTVGEKLLLAQWLGKDLTKEIPQKLQLQLEVRDSVNALVSTGIQNIILGQPFDFTLLPLASNFQAIQYQGTLNFNANELNYKISDFSIELKPSGAIFDFSIPVTGYFETDLIHQEKKYYWKIKVLP